MILRHEKIIIDPYDPNALDSALLTIKTPLPELFVITSLFGKEELSKPFRYIATTYSRNVNVKGEKLIGRAVTVKINHIDDKTGTDTPRYINGIVHRMKANTSQNGWRQYTLEIVPQLHLLGWTSDVGLYGPEYLER